MPADAGQRCSHLPISDVAPDTMVTITVTARLDPDLAVTPLSNAVTIASATTHDADPTNDAAALAVGRGRPGTASLSSPHTLSVTAHQILLVLRDGTGAGWLVAAPQSTHGHATAVVGRDERAGGCGGDPEPDEQWFAGRARRHPAVAGALQGTWVTTSNTRLG